MVILTIYINHFIKFKHVFSKVRCIKKSLWEQKQYSSEIDTKKICHEAVTKQL